MKSKVLVPGDTIGIVAPASPPRSEERIERSVRYFERLGYRVELGKHLRDGMEQPSYLSARDEHRLADLHAMFKNKAIRAIFYHRGGFGSLRLLDKVDYNLIRQNPKILVGYSDATALFAALYKKAVLRSMFFGPMPGVDLWDEVDPITEEYFWRAMTTSRSFEFGDVAITRSTRRTQTIEGKLIGGNLTVFCSLMGTPFQPSFRGIVPIFEDIDEKPRRVDACLAQLRLAGAFTDAKAILLGHFTNCNSDPESPTRSLDEILNEYFLKTKVPILRNIPFGHEKRMWTLPYGGTLRITIKSESAHMALARSPLE